MYAYPPFGGMHIPFGGPKGLPEGIPAPTGLVKKKIFGWGVQVHMCMHEASVGFRCTYAHRCNLGEKQCEVGQCVRLGVEMRPNPFPKIKKSVAKEDLNVA